MSGSGISWAICKPAPRSRQTITPTPHHSFFTGRMPFLPPNQQRQSTEGTKIRANTESKIITVETVGICTKDTGQSQLGKSSRAELPASQRTTYSHSYDYALDTSHTDTDAYTQTSTHPQQHKHIIKHTRY